METRDAHDPRGSSVRRFANLALIMALGLGSVPVARAGGHVGARYGQADVSDDILKGGVDLGGTNLVGLQVSFDLATLLEIEAAGEYVSEEFSFTEGLFEGIHAAGDGKYEEMALFATGRFDLLDLMILPLKGYAGGGVNVHWIDQKIDRIEANDDQQQGQLDDAIKKVAGDSSEAGWHVVAGIRFAPVKVPLSVFLEGRYMDGLDNDLSSSKSIYLGVNLAL